MRHTTWELQYTLCTACKAGSLPKREVNDIELPLGTRLELALVSFSKVAASISRSNSCPSRYTRTCLGMRQAHGWHVPRPPNLFLPPLAIAILSLFSKRIFFLSAEESCLRFCNVIFWNSPEASAVSSTRHFSVGGDLWFRECGAREVMFSLTTV